MAQQRCSKCGLPKSQWTGNNGQGYTKDGQAYCCEGCADNTGCTCGSDRARS